MSNEAPLPSLEHLRWSARPDVHRPVLITAFEGWNDAGDAATAAARYLADEWEAERFADIDPEVFYDFTSTRPEVRFDDLGQREIVWPENELLSARAPDGTDVVFLIGTEPQLRWRTFCGLITTLAQWLDVSLVLSFGALLAEVPHSRPVLVYGTGSDDMVNAELGLSPSGYEGPTGIVGVLQSTAHSLGLRSASLWAAVPTYLSSAPSPKAALALVQRAARLLDVDVETDELVAATREYEEQIDEVLEGDDDSAAFVRRLEEAFDEDEENLLGEGEALVAEVERFLRGRGA